MSSRKHLSGLMFAHTSHVLFYKLFNISNQVITPTPRWD